MYFSPMVLVYRIQWSITFLQRYFLFLYTAFRLSSGQLSRNTKKQKKKKTRVIYTCKEGTFTLKDRSFYSFLELHSLRVVCTIVNVVVILFITSIIVVFVIVITDAFIITVITSLLSYVGFYLFNPTFVFISYFCLFIID